MHHDMISCMLGIITFSYVHSCQCHEGKFWLGAPGPSVSWMASTASECDSLHQPEPEHTHKYNVHQLRHRKTFNTLHTCMESESFASLSLPLSLSLSHTHTHAHTHTHVHTHTHTRTYTHILTSNPCYTALTCSRCR